MQISTKLDELLRSQLRWCIYRTSNMNCVCVTTCILGFRRSFCFWKSNWNWMNMWWHVSLTKWWHTPLPEYSQTQDNTTTTTTNKKKTPQWGLRHHHYSQQLKTRRIYLRFVVVAVVVGKWIMRFDSRVWFLVCDDFS